MCEKLADHKTTVDVHMFNSCFHLEPASQGRDILEVNLCTPHYQKYKNYETLQSCYMKVEKDVSAGKAILCLTCYKNSPI